MISAAEQAEMSVDIACRTALTHRGVSYITLPINIQCRRVKGKNYSKHKVAGHTSDFCRPCYVRAEVDRKGSTSSECR